MARNVNFRSSLEMRRNYVVEIIEQPASKVQRFRYASEVDGSRSVGSIPGVHSTSDRKTYPTIRVRGYNGPMMVMLSLVNPEDDRVHPHAITGNDARYSCTNGVIYTFVDGPEVSFNNVGILCVKSKTDEVVTAALRERQKVKIDPFKAGFDHIDDRSLINFNAVRLCFTVYIPEGELKPHDRRNFKKYNIDLTPVASTVVYDAKKLNELKIQYVNKSIGSMFGGTEIVILCEKYAGAHPEIVFVEGDWEEKAQITQYHKQMALVAITPPYRDPFCTRSVPVEVYLQRVSPRGVLERSAPASSEYIPALPKSHPSEIGIKRPPRNYIDTKKRKRPFTEHLSKCIQSTDATGDDDVQRVMDMLIQYFGGTPPIISNHQSFAEIAGSSNNAPVQQENMCWPQHSTFGTSNSFNQQVNSSVDCIDPRLYSNVNATTSGFNQKIDRDPQKPIPYPNSFDPLTPDHRLYKVDAPDGLNEPLVHGAPLTTYNANYTNMLENNALFTAMPPGFTTIVPQEGANMDFVKNRLTNPMPNLIPTASTSYRHMPDVLSPMSQDGGSVNVDTNCNSAVETDHFNMFDDNTIGDNEYQNMTNGGTLENAAADTNGYPSNLLNTVGFEYDMENLSDELKKVTF